MVELKKVGNYIFRGMSILGATGVLLGGIVLLSKPQNLLADSAVWSIPYIGSSLKWFWEWPWTIAGITITNQKLVGFGLTIIGLNYFKVPHAVAWGISQIPHMEGVAQTSLAMYLSVFEYIENLFIPRLTAPDAVFRTKKWQKEYTEFVNGWNSRMSQARQVSTDSLEGIFIPTKGALA